MVVAEAASLDGIGCFPQELEKHLSIPKQP